jgi:endonuclease/exonuclease/phosphatase family protein
MGVFTGKSVYARHRHGQNCAADPAQAGAIAWAKNLGLCGCLILLFAGIVQAETVRVATYNVSLNRKGPGLLVRDLLRGEDAQIAAVVAVIARVKPDILLLNEFDFDLGGVALGLFADQLAEAGVVYPYRFARPPNSGLASGIDLDGDGRKNGPEDAQGFGKFSGARGMAILSRYPIDDGNAQDFSSRLWKDLPGATLPIANGKPFPSQAAWDVQRLSSKGHWDVPIILPDATRLHLLAAHATPPVFDGPEDRNGLRNRDEIRFWSLYLAKLPPDAAFVILGDLNADPMDGEGSHGAINALLADPRIQDVAPASKGAVAASMRQGGPNVAHLSDPAMDTVDWDEARTPGNMRVDYVLPSANLDISGAGVFWPAPEEDGFDLVGSDGSLGSQHRLVWVDIVR